MAAVIEEVEKDGGELAEKIKARVPERVREYIKASKTGDSSELTSGRVP